ncbi:glycosyltransferase family 2 protein [Hymenobacter sp. AT01-02]|uniref:glycosyltransferase family 2 protein n=1 Tax=Hymenobacter sp. AT01-02 TaxID=1571877 RepID=UPI0006988D1C|nr:glycosyltransferase family 2 protein [Hymenobacter sp. AT01-02]
MPKVTVIIPNYNHALYLPKRIDSVLGQTERDIEVILLDDCSPDNSREIIAHYAAQDKRIKVVLNEQNSGSTFRQWNKGCALATGEYIWIAESDDYADPRLLETLVARLEADPQVGIAYCMSISVDEKSQPVGNHYAYYEEVDAQRWAHDFTMPGIELVQRYMPFRCIIPNASAVVVRRSVIEQTGPADETMRLSGDWAYWSKILASSKVAFVAEPLNYFRQHTNNVRSKALVTGLALAEEAHILKFLQQFGPLDSAVYQKKIDSLLQRWFYGMVNYNITPKVHKEIYARLAQVDPHFARRFASAFSRFLFGNNMSGIRQFIGDKLLAR